MIWRKKVDKILEKNKPIAVTEDNLALVGAQLYHFLKNHTLDMVVMHSNFRVNHYVPSVFRDCKLTPHLSASGQSEPRVVDTTFSIPLYPKRAIALDYRDKPAIEFRPDENLVLIKRWLRNDDVMTVVILIH